MMTYGEFNKKYDIETIEVVYANHVLTEEEEGYLVFDSVGDVIDVRSYRVVDEFGDIVFELEGVGEKEFTEAVKEKYNLVSDEVYKRIIKMENKQYFTQLEILLDMREVITSFDMVYYDDLIYEAFDSPFYLYVTGRHEAEKALEQYGVFKALEKVKEYELANYGEVLTNIDDPEALATKLYLVLGIDTLFNDYPELRVAYYTVLDREINSDNDKILLDVIDKLIEELD